MKTIYNIVSKEKTWPLNNKRIETMTKLQMKKFENIAKHITNLDKAVRAFIASDEAVPSHYDGVDRKVHLHWSCVCGLLKYMVRYNGLALSLEQIDRYKSLLDKKIDTYVYNFGQAPAVAENLRDLTVELSNLRVEYVLDKID